MLLLLNKRKLIVLKLWWTRRGCQIESRKGLCQLKFSYIVGLFSGNDGDYEPMDGNTSFHISTEDNTNLIFPFSRDEFKEVIFKMHPHVLGPDKFSLAFYHHFWNVCREDIFYACCWWLKEGFFPHSLKIQLGLVGWTRNQKGKWVKWLIKSKTLLAHDDIIKSAKHHIESVKSNFGQTVCDPY